MYFSWLLLSSVIFGGDVSQEMAEIVAEPVVVTLIEEAVISARETGLIAALEAKEGMLVKEGVEIGRIDDDEAQIELQRATVELQIAKKNAENDVNSRYAKKSWEVTKAELKRALDSIADYPKSVPEAEVDRLRLAVERAQLEIERSDRDLEIAKLNTLLLETALSAAKLKVQRRKIMAGISGMLVEVFHDRGEWVQEGTPIARVLRMDRLRVEALFDARSITPPLIGNRVELIVELPGKAHESFDGKVVFVNPQVDPVNGLFRVWAEVENRDMLLRPGLSGRLKIQTVRVGSP